MTLYSPMSLPGTSKRKLPGLDHLRALAIVLVFVYHYRLFSYPQWIQSVGNYGWTGVDLFFVLSGFLISSQLFMSLRKTDSLELKSFYIKRAFRILPVYGFMLVMYFSFPFLREKGDPSPLWKYLTFTQNYGLDLSRFSTFSHAWSLCVEEQFYLVFPLILLLFLWARKYDWVDLLLPVFFFGGMFLRNRIWHGLESADGSMDSLAWLKGMYYPTYTRLDGLLVGIGAAALFHYKPHVKERLLKRGNLLLLIGLVLLALALYLTRDEVTYSTSVYGFPMLALAFGVLVMAAQSPSCVLSGKAWGLTEPIAILSYSLYLCHKSVCHVTQELLGRAGLPKDSTWMLLCCAAASLLVAFLMRLCIEKPFLRIRDKILYKKAKVVSFGGATCDGAGATGEAGAAGGTDATGSVDSEATLTQTH
jgi:peptidoglycan/LPS O-acetylase OafA/YrhL